MKRILVVLAAALALAGCDFLNITNTNTHDQGSGGNPASGSTVCEGLVASINVDSESGSSVNAGTTITFSADPRDASGNSVPAQCKQGPVTASPIGECVVADASFAPTLDAIELYAAAAGECKCRVEFAGKVGTSEAVTITP